MAIRVAVLGALGKMGQAVVKAVLAEEDMDLVAAVDPQGDGQQDVCHAMGMLEPCGVPVLARLEDGVDASGKEALNSADVAVDFTHPEVVYKNAEWLIDHHIAPVIGTTGLTPVQMSDLEESLIRHELGGIVAPNFALGGVLMMRFAKEASKYFDHAEIIEYHHNQKADAPSGTSLKTAQLMDEERHAFGLTNAKEKELQPGARGATSTAGIHIHSIRLPGLVAHQEVVFGNPGEVLTIRHDSLARESFMPGVLLAIRKVVNEEGFIYGLEHLL